MPLLKARSRLSKVNTRHLLDDVADSYRHSLPQTIIVEAVANALDAAASSISFSTNEKARSLTVLDNGVGMTEEEFDAYHDLAQSGKVRGDGIGFAGLGAKLAHKLCTSIKTDTRSTDYSAGSNWQWKKDDLEFKTRRARISSNGTKVEYRLSSSSSELLDANWIQATLVEHFGPLFDRELSNFYVWHATYPNGVRFSVDGFELPTVSLVESPENVSYQDILPTRGKKPVGKAGFFLAKRKLAEEHQGIAITTHGKLITRTTFGLTPSDSDRITGWIEIPEMVKCLTLNKQDFITHGRLGHTYRRFRDQAKKAYSNWLTDIGKNVERRDARNAPRRLETELAELAKLVPEIDFLLGQTLATNTPVRATNGTTNTDEVQGSLITGGANKGGMTGDGEVPVDQGNDEGVALSVSESGQVKANTRRRKTRRGPRVKLVHESVRNDMSWIDADSVMINTAHPTYTKAQRENQVRYHQRNAALIALCDAASEEAGLRLLRESLSRWGRQ